MQKRVYTEEQINGIVNDYKNGVKCKEMFEKWNINSYQLSNIIRENKLEQRSPAKSAARQASKKTVKAKKCPNCHKVIKLEGAKYCPFCATDIRDDKDIACEQISRLAFIVQGLPINTADEATRLINELSRYIRNS